MMKKTNSLVSHLTLVLALGLAILGTGCTHMVKISVKPASFPVAEKLPHQAVLVINSDLQNYKYEFPMMGDKWVFPFGQSLQDYARQVANASFQQVKEVSSEEKAAGETSADLILVPRAVKADQGLGGAFAWDKVNFTLVVEWIAKDRATHNTVWLKTITSDASETGGNAFTGDSHRKILMQKLFDDLSMKTFNAMQNAPELKSPKAVVEKK